MKASIFHNYTTWVEDKSLILITKSIKEGKYKQEITEIRKQLSKGNTAAADQLKKQLPAFTPSGTFNNGRKASLLSEYSNHIIIDIDKITPSEATAIIQKVAAYPFTFAAFISPSGNGVKIIVLVDSKEEHHKLAFTQVAVYFETQLQLKIDPSGKDVCRLCFMSYDSNCYRNINATPYHVDIQPIKPMVVDIPSEIFKPSKWPVIVDFDSSMAWSVELTQRKNTYTSGNRNNFIHHLACNCNRLGIPQSFTESFIGSNYDLDTKEQLQTIQSAYRNNLHESAKFAKSAKSEDYSPPTKDELLMQMPYLPESIYDKLPAILKDGCMVLKDRREKDIFITGALSVISGCMRNVMGLYRGKEHYSNLFVFIIAPAASGKGALTYSKQLGDKYHNKLVDESKAKRKFYEMEMAEYRRVVQKSKDNVSNIELPEEPAFKVLYIPANNSSARIIQHLKEGDEQGIFCETEADTMGNVLKQDWGSYSDLLRKAFHHEPVSYSRKTNKEWIELKMPRLSVALAGTPGQVEGLIKSAEDGLFSRFIFYVFKSESIWIKAGPTMNGLNLSKYYEDLSYRVSNFVEFLDTQEQTLFHLTPNQWDRLNNYGEDCLNTLSTFISEDLSSTSKRLGLILFRLSMILTALRYFDNAEAAAAFTCSDEDFDIALQMVKVYQEHAVFMFKELPKNGSVTDKAMKSFFDALPDTFKRKDAVQLADDRFGIKNRSADSYLSKLVSAHWLDQARMGNFTKVKR